MSCPEETPLNKTEPDTTLIWDPGGGPVPAAKPNHHLCVIINATTVVCDSIESESNDSSAMSRTELDSHANMPVVGRHALVLSRSGQSVDVNPFTPDYLSMNVPIVDAAVKYDCPYDGKSYILILRNALHVPSMQNNLIPPFMMREAGLQVNDVPKI